MLPQLINAMYEERLAGAGLFLFFGILEIIQASNFRRWLLYRNSQDCLCFKISVGFTFQHLVDLPPPLSLLMFYTHSVWGGLPILRKRSSS